MRMLLPRNSVVLKSKLRLCQSPNSRTNPVVAVASMRSMPLPGANPASPISTAETPSAATATI